MKQTQIKKNISILVIADIINKILPLLTFPYLTRILGPEIYGKYGFAINVSGFLFLLASPGFVPYGGRAIAQHPGDEVSIGAKICGLRLVFALVAFVILSIYTLSLAPEDDVIRLLIMLSGLLMFTNAVSLDWLLTGKSLIAPVAFATICSQLVYTAAIVLFVKSPANIWVIPVATLAGEILSIGFLFYVVYKHFGIVIPRVTKADFKEIVPQTLLLGFASLMIMTYDKVDMIILGYFRPMAEVGVYAATYKIMWMAMSFQPILSRVFLPMFAASAINTKIDTDCSEQYLKMTFFAVLPVMFGGVLLADPLTNLLIGDQYIGSGLILTLLLPNILANGLYSYYTGMRLFAANRNSKYVISVSIGAILNVLLNLIFVPNWGIAAAAVSTSISQFAVAGLAAWYSRDIKSPSLWKCLIRPLVASTVMLALLWILIQVKPGFNVILLIIIGALIYLITWYGIQKLANSGHRFQ